MTLGFIKQLQMRVCVEEILKVGGGLSDGGDEVAETPQIPFSLSWWQIPSPLEVFPGSSGLGQGEQENGTRSVL